MHSGTVVDELAGISGDMKPRFFGAGSSSPSSFLVDTLGYPGEGKRTTRHQEFFRDQEFMERFTIPSDKDFLRMAMLKQEGIFREQVGELHRVYRVQKALMRDLRREAVARRWGSAWSNNSATDQQQQEEKECFAAAEGEDVELTLATGYEARRRMVATKESGGVSEDDDDGFKRRAPWFSDCLTLRIM